jgi:hypothetical protein
MIGWLGEPLVHNPQREVGRLHLKGVAIRHRGRRCSMGALTLEERRRVFLSRQQQASRQQLARLTVPVTVPESALRRRRLAAILKSAMIAALLATGWFTVHVVEFRLPPSMAEVLPRA